MAEHTVEKDNVYYLNTAIQKPVYVQLELVHGGGIIIEGVEFSKDEVIRLVTMARALLDAPTPILGNPTESELQQGSWTR